MIDLIIRCRTCNKVITRYSGHIGFAERMNRIRNHYKKFHPSKFKGFIKKSIKTKEGKHIRFKTKDGNNVSFKVKSHLKKDIMEHQQARKEDERLLGEM